ncbi:acyl- middle domain-containing protein [Cystoisospora suis]|uniref:Acyl-middle domain-containing protein n=1 Tax=Cystoisospora suis TaxID=483139 RepID=A0A2C6KN44_9APIC|nr:acyl- middle domain-containing protein [Cystoisospora suis]
MEIIPAPTFSVLSEEKDESLGPPAAVRPRPEDATHIDQVLLAGVPVSSWSYFQWLLAGDSHVCRRGIQQVALENLELFTPRFNVLLSVQRDLALERLRKICRARLFSILDFDRAPRRILTLHECCGMLDASLATKFTVQFNLFGGTLLRLGTETNPLRQELLSKIDTLDEIGCFALTELGYGNNAVCLETTATYDDAREQFVINSPTILSQKYWITNGALHASWAIVFAQLITRGVKRGVHAFLVPIRRCSGTGDSSSEDLRVCPGVTIEDMGHRIGCNGVDNAKIAFDNVRIPRENLLDAVSKVRPDGGFVSIVEPEPIVFSDRRDNARPVSGDSEPFTEATVPQMATQQRPHREVATSAGSAARNRFLLQTEQLLSGRLCIASMMLGGIKVVLTNTLRYSASRLSTGPSGLSDTPILAFAVQRQALMPLLAQAIVLMAWTNEVKALYERFTRIISETAKARDAFLSRRAASGERQKGAAEEEEADDLNRNNNPFFIGSMAIRGLLEAHASARLEVVLHCCALKPTVAWCAQEIATAGRERCGGGGFLSANMFGEFIGAAHAGMTAEGDNRVLYAKVSKEIYTRSTQQNAPAWLRAIAEPPQDVTRDTPGDDALAVLPEFSPLFATHLDPHTAVPPPPAEPSFPPALACASGEESTGVTYPPSMYASRNPLLRRLHTLLRLRIARKLRSLRQLLAMKQDSRLNGTRSDATEVQAGKWQERSSSSQADAKRQMVYDLWMADLDTHDLIFSSSPASLAKCFADLAAFEAYLRMLGHLLQHGHRSCSQALEAPLCLFGLTCIEDDLAFMVEEKMLRQDEVHTLRQKRNAWVDRVASISMQLIDCFGIPDEVSLRVSRNDV